VIDRGPLWTDTCSSVIALQMVASSMTWRSVLLNDGSFRCSGIGRALLWYRSALLLICKLVIHRMKYFHF
jgi:hypothetical protein